MARELTALENLPSTKNKCKRDGVWNPFRLDDVGAENQKTGWDVDAIDEGWGGELVGGHPVGCSQNMLGELCATVSHRVEWCWSQLGV